MEFELKAHRICLILMSLVGALFSFRSVVISDLKVIREALNHPSIQGRPGMLTSRERTGGVTRGRRIKFLYSLDTEMLVQLE